MNKYRKDRLMGRRTTAVIAALVLVGAAAFLLRPRPVSQVQASIVGLAAQEGQQAGFARAEAPLELVFPQDHGPHPDFQTEWWYYTGNLQAADGRRFGYQLTFFRRAAQPPAQRLNRASDWAVEQIYLAHFTLTDESASRFQAFERLERGAAGLAGARIDPEFRVWLHDWSVQQTGADRYHLSARQDDLVLSLDLVDTKGLVLQGDRGYSRKGPELGNASYYYSQTHLQTTGTVETGGQSFAVAGLSWMDREFSTSSLSAGQVGWDWFALQLDDGSELMVYKIRNKDGTPGEYSSGAWIDPDGVIYPLQLEDYQIEVEDTWTSPHSGGRYPSAWQVRVASLNLNLQINPLLADQELNVSYSYWEGAVRVSGNRDGNQVYGRGYVELTGYSKSMEGGL